MNNTEIRNLLASFLFTGDDVFKMIRDLSGGEKGRLSLAKLMLSKANLLLDEPTNHLDITSREILEEAVRNYEGTVIYVSHDRYFINRTATRILELDHRHFVNYQGNYDYYLEKKADPAFDASKAVSGTLPTGTDVPSPAAGNAASAASSLLSYQEQKERKQQLQKLRTALSNCEKEIGDSEQASEEIDRQMALPENAVNSAKLNELVQKKNGITAVLEELYQKWEELSEAIENFN